MVNLNPIIKQALVGMDFVERYEKLSNAYSAERTPDEERLKYIDGELVMDMIAAAGYTPLFDEKEKFYKIKEEQKGGYTFGFHIILYAGMVDLVWVVKKKDQVLLGSPWSVYSRRLIDPKYRIKKPIFSDYDDLEEILNTAFDMYNDFKKAVLEVA